LYRPNDRMEGKDGKHPTACLLWYASTPQQSRRREGGRQNELRRHRRQRRRCYGLAADRFRRPSAWVQGLHIVTLVAGNQGPLVFLVARLPATLPLRLAFCRLRPRVGMLRTGRQRGVLRRLAFHLPLQLLDPRFQFGNPRKQQADDGLGVRRLASNDFFRDDRSNRSVTAATASSWYCWSASNCNFTERPPCHSSPRCVLPPSQSRSQTAGLAEFGMWRTAPRPIAWRLRPKRCRRWSALRIH
jgi:hypothetical protein